jgi:CRISPR-associated helicase Cas3/CRISPR-associated endonuclease Cas3-HD
VAYLAHSANAAGRPQTLEEHLRRTAEIAASFASSFGASDEARLAGLLHDLGKYGDLFQLRLQGKASGVDHWSAGALLACQRCNNVAVALAAQGHHTGLQSLVALQDLSRHGLADGRARDLRAPDADPDVLRERLLGDGLSLSVPPSTLYGPRLRDTASAMLDVRMLFSALVDADFLDTEAHFAGATPIQPEEADGALLKPNEALAILLDHLVRVAADSPASSAVNGIRADLLEECLAAARQPQGLWTLSAPTGAGKTLAMMAFALRHAVERDLRRVIMVIPYLSIIEQNAGVLEDIFRLHFGRNYLHEHHSMARSKRESERTQDSDLDSENESHRRRNTLSDAWRAPIIITTSVQLLESLFSNRPSACRKLHRLARSVILFDEVQTIPDHLAVPTLAALSWLAKRYQTSVVFSTATQPAFDHFDKHVRAIGDSGWRPREIASPSLRLFDRVCRTQVSWPDLESPTSWEEIALQLTQTPQPQQALCIVNVKRHARDLFVRLQELGTEGVFHLSTAMCPAHRRAVLRLVKWRLKRGLNCILISTQCIEAGVDIDFPVVYRALGPLEAIAQAAGRCNRNGLLPGKGEVQVFLPEPGAGRLYPSGAYEQATDVTRMLLRERGPDDMDIGNPALFEEYYRRFYRLVRSEDKKPELRKAIKRQDFAEVASQYRLIEKDTINLLVPYKRDIYHALAEEVRRKGLTADWMRRAQPYAIGLFRPNDDKPVWGWLEKVYLARGSYSDEWFIYTNEKDYHRTIGLDEPSALIA